MTHDELLAKLGENAHIPKWDECSCGNKVEGFEHHLNDVFIKNSNALRAVVELHKPVESEYFDNPVCAACSPDIDIWFDYPCKTIKAIEKELG